jgi:hypothetical protein
MYKALVANPHFVPFTETFDSKSFLVVSDIAIDMSEFDGDATRDRKNFESLRKLGIQETALTCFLWWTGICPAIWPARRSPGAEAGFPKRRHLPERCNSAKQV